MLNSAASPSSHPTDMQIPILSGVFASETPDFRVSYPRNMVPVPRQNGISNGYLRPADGIVSFGDGPGFDRGGINWNDVCYRVMGNDLVRVDADGAITSLGDIAGSEPVVMAYSFDRLAIVGGGNAYYWNGSKLERIKDKDLGTVIDVEWIDGYFMFTDGSYNIVSDLNDPKSINPLRYGSSEADPDPIKANFKTRAGEIYSVNRYTVELFGNVGQNAATDVFPFDRNEGGQINRGSMGTHCACLYDMRIAFLGGARGEPPAVWVGLNGASAKISTGEIDTLLLDYTQDELANSVMEARFVKNHQFLYLHLPNKTLVYDGAASATVQEAVWFIVDSGIVDSKQYRARGMVWCYDKWICGDPTSSKIGVLDEALSSHHGEVTGWDFGTSIVYNSSRGAIFNELELVALTGRVALGPEPVVWTSYSVDGETWSQEKPIAAGKQGDRAKRLIWRLQGRMSNFRIQRFRGTSDAHIAFARLEAQLEQLNA